MFMRSNSLASYALPVIAVGCYFSLANAQEVGGGVSIDGIDGGMGGGGWADGGADDVSLNTTWLEWNESIGANVPSPFVYEWNPLGPDNPYDPYNPNDPLNPLGDGWNQHCGPAAACGGEPSEPIPFPIQSGPVINQGTAGSPRVTLASPGSDIASAAANNVFPKAVALEYSNSRILCSGVVVSNLHVLTAAHCLCGDPPIFAIVGTSSIPGSQSSGFTRKIELSFGGPVFYREGFCEIYRDDPLGAMQGGDAALIEFSSEITGDILQVLHPADILSTEEFAFSAVQAVGWGESDNNWRPGQKNYTTLQLAPRLCGEAEEASYGCSSGAETIATNPPNDTCFADSGGPVYATGYNGERRLLAITSRSLYITEGGMCGSGGIYTSLENPAIKNWMFSVLD